MPRLITLLLLIHIGKIPFDPLFAQQTAGLEWAKRIGSTPTKRASDMVLDAGGNIYITGTFSGTVDFDPGPGIFNLTAIGDFDIYLTKLTIDGNFVWTRSMGGTGYDEGFSITQNDFGDIYVTGRFRNIVDFDPGFNLTATGNEDAFPAKFSAAGNFI